MPRRIVGGLLLLRHRARKDEVGGLEVVDRADVGRAAGLDLAGDPQRSLARLEVRSGITHDGRIGATVVQDDGVVPDPGREGVGRAVCDQEHRQHDERVVFGDEETARLQLDDAGLAFGEGGPELPVALGGEAGHRIILFRLLEALLDAGQQRVRRLRLLGPAVAGARLVVVGFDDGLRHLRQAVAVRPVAHHVHLRLHQQHPATGHRVGQLQDRLAVEIVVAGKHAVEQQQIAPQALFLVGVDLVEVGRDDRRRQHRRQPGQDLVDPALLGRQTLEGGHRLGGAHPQGQVDHVAALVDPLERGRPAGRLLDLRLKPDAVEQLPRVVGRRPHPRRPSRHRHLHLAHLHLAHLDLAHHGRTLAARGQRRAQAIQATPAPGGGGQQDA